MLGYSDKKLADFFNVSEQTINAWKKAHKEFFECLRAGKDKADAEVVSALYRRACGYTVETSKPVNVSDGSGEGSHVEQHTQEQHFPPEPGAAKMWLVNRQPEHWRDKQDMELTGKDGGPIMTAEARRERIKELEEKRTD